MKISINKFLLCVIPAYIFPNQAFAYVDPGSGALLLQMLIAGFVGALFYLRIYYRRIINFLLRKLGLLSKGE